MIIAISGTPGVGKTAVAKLVAKKTGAKYVSLSAAAARIPGTYDRKRRVKAVSVSELRAAAAKHIDKKRDSVLDGHLAHLLKADAVIILRCAPPQHLKRMAAKRWRSAKMRENLEAEILGAAVIEAKEMHGNGVIEIDATRRTPQQAAALIVKILNNHSWQKKHRPRIDWTERYLKYLIGKRQERDRKSEGK